MTAPNTTTIEDYENSLNAPAAQKAAEIKLEGDDIPEEFRGKSVEDVLKLANGLKEALKISEHGRLSAATAMPAAPVAAPVVEEPKELTDEELATLHSEDPVRAIRVMQEQAVRIAQRNLEARINPLITGTTSAVETSVRTKYPEEFEALGPEISAMAASLPNKNVLSDPRAWDQLIAYVRGENFDKMYAFKQGKSGRAALANAQQQQAEAAGISFTPHQSAPVGRQALVADDYTKEIARNLDMTIEDYLKWSKV